MKIYSNPPKLYYGFKLKSEDFYVNILVCVYNLLQVGEEKNQYSILKKENQSLAESCDDMAKKRERVSLDEGEENKANMKSACKLWNNKKFE